MRAPTWFFAMLLTLVAFVAACGKVETDQGEASAPSAQRLMLSQGYSMLYFDASRLQFAKLILYIKVESDAVNQIVTAISDYGRELEKELERMARDFPAVRIDLDPLPEMEKRKRSDVNEERAISFAPVVGRTGGDFERTLLLSMSAILSQESHLCKVMADEEPDPGLKKFLLDSKQRFDDLYDRAVDLLNREYFKGGVSQPEKH
jgi:hypothetical protein